MDGARPLPSSPPPPPPSGGGRGEAHDMQLPPHLQAMMREVQATLGGQRQQHSDDQLLPMLFGHSKGHGGRGYPQQLHNDSGYGGGRGYGGRGGRGGGQRGRGRGGGGGRGRGGRGNGFGGRGGGRGGGRSGRHFQQQECGPVKRKRDFDGAGAARFFLPSCLEDPWLSLLQSAPEAVMTASAHTTYETQLPPSAMIPAAVQYHQHHVQPPQVGRVLFQPSFLSDPWAAFVR